MTSQKRQNEVHDVIAKLERMSGAEIKQTPNIDWKQDRTARFDRTTRVYFSPPTINLRRSRRVQREIQRSRVVLYSGDSAVIESRKN